MKKTLIALAALAATGAFAQVSVYGRLDAGYANTTTTAPTGAVGASTTMVDTKANGVQSHNSVSSMWGVQGTGDLGGGMKANFKLEQDIYTANGNTGTAGSSGGAAGTAAFNRTSLLGVSGAFGSVAFGRDYVPTFKLQAAVDNMGNSRISAVQNAGVASTVPNLVFYSTPVMSGFQVNVAYGNTDTSVGSSETSAKTTNITATYTNGPLMVGVGSGSYEVKTGGVAGGTYVLGLNTFTSVDKTSSTTLVASYDFGTVKVAGSMVSTKASQTSGREAKFDETNLAATVPMGKVTLLAQVGTNKWSYDTWAENMTGTDMVIGADYALSAKTALFAKTGTVGKVSGNSQEYKINSTAIGLKTVF